MDPKKDKNTGQTARKAAKEKRKEVRMLNKQSKKTPLKKEMVGRELQRNVSTRKGTGVDQFSDDFKGDMKIIKIKWQKVNQL